MGQIKKLYQSGGNVEITASTESNAVYPVTASSAVYHQSSWGTGGSGQTVGNILTALDQGFQYMGVAGVSTVPVTATHKIFYLASEEGVYSNFGGISVSGLTVLKNSGSGWSKEELNITGGGGGGTPVATGGYIGTTPVRSSSGAQNLTGISNLYVESGGKIYFGGTGDVYIEYTSDGFHFSKSVYSDEQVSAAGAGSGSGGGGGGTSYSAGDGISISSNTISVKKASTSALGGVIVGTGLSIDSNGVLSATGGGSGTAYLAGSGISISNGEISAKIGTGLAFDSNGNIYATGGGSGAAVSWGTYNSTAHTIVLTVDGTSYTLCENGYSAGGGVSSESDPIFTAHAAYGVTSTKISHWDSAYSAMHSHSNKSVLDGITSTKVSNWDTAYGWGNHASAGYLTSHQAISTLTLSAGAFSAGTWTPTGSSKSFNIPTTAQHLSYGDGTVKSFLDDLPNGYVTLDTIQTIEGEKTFSTNPIKVDSTSGIEVNGSSYIDIGGARLVYDAGAKALHVTVVDGDTSGTPVSFFADGNVSAGGTANQSTHSYVTTGSGAQSIAGTKTFTGTLIASGEAQFNNDVTITADDVIINALMTLGGVGISGSTSLLTINKNTKFSGISNVTNSTITIQQIVDRIIALETQIQS